MKLIWPLIMTATLAINLASAADAGATHFYVQLVRGTDKTESLPKGTRQLGPKLKQELGQAFKAQNYWEANRQEVLVTSGRPAHVSLGSDRSVQIDISGNRRTVTAYYKGRATERRSGPRGDGITLIGDNRGGGLWFVVVRRDRPGN
jgi:hypothetical protein